MNARPDHKSIAGEIFCAAIDDLHHALASHDFREFHDAEEYGKPAGCCLYCERDRRDSLHLGRREAAEERIAEILGREVGATVRGRDDGLIVIDRWVWIERYAATHPADPVPPTVPADAYAGAPDGDTKRELGLSTW